MQFKLPVVKVLLNFTVSFQGELYAIYYLIGCFLFFNILLFPPPLYFRSVYKSFPLKNYTLLKRLNVKIEKCQRNSCRNVQLSRNSQLGDFEKKCRILEPQKSPTGPALLPGESAKDLEVKGGAGLKPSPWRVTWSRKTAPNFQPMDIFFTQGLQVPEDGEKHQGI